mgnify:CR=1 FL=1
MRGTVQPGVLAGRAVGITPAHAGNRKVTLVLDAATRDHPRACGEQLLHDLHAGTKLGSPPRMRGTGRYSGWSCAP